MNFKKIAAAGLSLAAAAALTVSASANSLVVVSDPEPNLTSNNGMWMVKLYVPSEGIDLGIDCLDLGKAVFTVTPTEPDDFEGAFGGAVVMSSGPVLSEDHNWIQSNFWGVYDEEHEIFGRDDATDTNPIKVQNSDVEYVYTLTLNIDDSNKVLEDSYASPDAYVQIALSDWSNEVFSEIEVLSLDLYNKAGDLIGSFNSKGKFTPANGGAASPTVTVEDKTSDAAAATDTAAPATTAPAAGDTTAATNSSKGSPNTGIADVAAIAGIAVVAGGAVVLSRKRK